MELSAHERRVVAEVFKPDLRLGKIARFLLMGWMMVSLLPACYFAEHYLLLVWNYGFLRVHKEGLHFTYIPSAKEVDDLMVSNGDHITKAHGFMAVPMALLVWLALIVAGYLVIRYVSRRRGGVVFQKSLDRIYGG
jgi:hypothetical protein